MNGISIALTIRSLDYYYEPTFALLIGGLNSYDYFIVFHTAMEGKFDSFQTSHALRSAIAYVGRIKRADSNQTTT